MKTEFNHYYAPDPEVYEKLIKEALVVFDANVLLHLYRLPRASADALLATLEKLGSRIWIPYNVAVEYQRNRLDVILASRKRLDDLLDSGKRSLAAIEREATGLEFDKRGMGDEAKKLIDAVKIASTQLESLATKAKDDQLGAGLKDPMRDKLDQLLAGRVGPKPESQAWLDEVYADAEVRYQSKIPPGFSDAIKKGATATEGGLQYQLQYGDMLLWRQVIDHVRTSDTKKVLLVTNDAKEDWWVEREGKKIGPHPHLVEEMTRLGGVDCFWIYNLTNFTEQARLHIDNALTDDVLTDVKRAALGSDLKNVLAGFMTAAPGSGLGASVTRARSSGIGSTDDAINAAMITYVNEGAVTPFGRTAGGFATVDSEGRGLFVCVKSTEVEWLSPSLIANFMAEASEAAAAIGCASADVCMVLDAPTARAARMTLAISIDSLERR